MRITGELPPTENVGRCRALAHCPQLDTVATSPRSPRGCADATASVSTTGSPRSRPTTSRTSPVHRRAPARLRRCPRRVDPRIQLRPRRRHRQQDQDIEASDVRPRQLRPTPHTSPPRPLTGPRQPLITQSAPEPIHLMGVVGSGCVRLGVGSGQRVSTLFTGARSPTLRSCARWS
jgi:hypothetical protein